MLVDDRIPWGQVMWRHSGSLVVILVLATAVCFLDAYLGPDQPLMPPLTLPMSLLGVAVSTFLGFRNNNAYDRFWEGRKLWGGIINASRTLARQALTLPILPSVAKDREREELAAWQRRLIYGCIAYAHALRSSLRGEEPWTTLEPLLPAEVLAELRQKRNVPAALAQWLGRQAASAAGQGWLSEQRLQQLDATVTELVSLQGGCERIRNTPLPGAYSMLTHRLVQAYCFILPFGLVKDLHFYTIVVSYATGFVFIMLDSIGQELEHPFALGPLTEPLTAMTTTIEINLRQALDEKNVPPDAQAVDGILI